MGRLRVFPTTEEWQQDLGRTLSDVLGEATPEMLRRIFEREDRGEILGDFEKYFATPAMQMWEGSIAPIVREGFNLPGAFYSKSRFEGVRRSGEEFLTQRVNPLMFASFQEAEQRNLVRQGMIANLLTGTQSLAVAPTRAAMFLPATDKGLASYAGWQTAISGTAADTAAVGSAAGAGGGGRGISSGSYWGGGW